MVTRELITHLYQQTLKLDNIGEVATYIPELANVDDSKFGIHMSTVHNQHFGVGDYQDKFSVQSISKLLSLTLAVKLKGKEILKRVGVEPSGTKFNSIIQLELENGIPRNPFINAGAIVICDILMSELENPLAEILRFINEIVKSNVRISKEVFLSEKATGFRNIALCNFMKAYGNIHNKPEDVLDLYFSICAIEMNCEELSKVLLYLANDGVHPIINHRVISESRSKRMNAIMQTCGFYDQSGEFAFRVGLPGKSGVSGGIVAVLPDFYCIAVWSPKLNKFGNSYRGMKFLEEFTTHSMSSIF